MEHRAHPPSAPPFFSPLGVALSANIYNTTNWPVTAGGEALKAKLGLLFSLLLAESPFTTASTPRGLGPPLGKRHEGDRLFIRLES